MRFHYLILACVLAHGALGDVVVPPPPTTTVTYDKLVGDLSEALVTRYQAGVTGLDTLATSWSTSVRSLSDQLTSGFAAYDANFCTPASFSKESGIIPAKFIGSAFNLTFTTGSCSFNETAYLVDGVKELQCMEPSMEYLKVPAKYVSKYYAAPSFTGKECVLTKSFGTATNTTLTVFDTSLKVSASELTAQITAELKNLLSVLGKSS